MSEGAKSRSFNKVTLVQTVATSSHGCHLSEMHSVCKAKAADNTLFRLVTHQQKVRSSIATNLFR
jgi:hypothetical protein